MLIELLVFLVFLVAFGLYRQLRPKNFPPGPLGIPVLGYLPFLSPDSHIKIGKVGDAYGKIYSLKMGKYWFVVLNDFETIKAALKQDAFSGRPNHLLAMEFIKNGIVYNEGPAWQEQRRFALKTLRDFGFGRISLEASIQEEVKEVTAYLRARANTPLELKELFAISILNALWHIATGDKFALDDPLPRKVYMATKEGFMEPNVQGAIYFLPWLAAIFPDSTGLNKVKEAIKIVRSLINNVIEEHRKNFIPGSRPMDYIDVYLQEMENSKDDPNSSFHREEGAVNLADSLINFFVAGSDTLSSSLGFAFLYLTTCQESLKKLHEEIDRVIGRVRLPDTSDRAKMPYTEAVINETYRLSSIVAGSVLHSTTEDTVFQGYKLPKGTIIMPNLFQVHHDKTYWGDPEEFRPERFLSADGSFHKDERVIPFSLGKRSCMAENMAQVEFFLFLTGVLQKFNVSPSPQHPLPGFTPKTAFVLSATPYKVILTERV